MLSLSRSLAPFLIAALVPIPACSQGGTVRPGSPIESADVFQNSVDGLQHQLADALAAAKDHNRPKLESLIKQTEIPNYEAWFTNAFGKEKGESWAGPYGRNLASRENELMLDFLEFGAEVGKFEIRKVNDAPKTAMETAMIDALQSPAEIFYAGWKGRPASPAFNTGFIGYFVFLDGRFRWDSTVSPLKVRTVDSVNKESVEEEPRTGTGSESRASGENTKKDGPYRPGVGGVTFPSCTFCPDPEYTNEARAKHVEGTVVLQVIIQPDGRATDIQIVKTPDPGLAENAVQAVSKWRFNPARGEDHQPVPVIVPIEVTFRISY